MVNKELWKVTETIIIIIHKGIVDQHAIQFSKWMHVMRVDIHNYVHLKWKLINQYFFEGQPCMERLVPH